MPATLTALKPEIVADRIRFGRSGMARLLSAMPWRRAARA